MSFDTTDNGWTIIICDGCGEEYETEYSDKIEAYYEARDYDGWLALPDGPKGAEWCHYCPSCKGTRQREIGSGSTFLAHNSGPTLGLFRGFV